MNTKWRIPAVALTFIVIALAIFNLTYMTSAHAGTCSALGCGRIDHISGGLSAAMTIRCNFGDPNSNKTLLPGMSSTSKCADTDQVRVDDGKEIWCWDPTTGAMVKYWDATGWYKIYDGNFFRCYLRRD